AAAQLRAVAKLLRERRFASVVNACDAGREGELIFRYVYQHARARLPVQRLWISSLTDDAIRRGFGALRPGRTFDALGDAARSRSEADWLVGLNATRAVTVRGRDGGGDALYSIGRVQTPTLAMLVERDRAIAAFVPRPYWEIRGAFRTDDGGRFTGMWRLARGGSAETSTGRVASAAIAQAIVDRDTPGSACVERVVAKTVREAPPLLFDLTSLQRTANRRFGFSAQRTLEIAQALYERHKVLTYPRTDSRHLTSDVARELPAVFEALAAIPAYATFASRLVAEPPRPSRRVVDDAKVHDHHAIIPTGKHAALDRDEERLFDLVTRRFVGAFFPDAEFAVTEAWLIVGAPITVATGNPLPPPELEARVASGDRDDGAVPIVDRLPPPPDRFVARGRVRMVAGWQEVAGIAPDRRDAETERHRDGRVHDGAQLPRLVEGQPLAGAYESLAKQTTPPPRYTEATLLGAMESAGKAIDDEALRAAMKDCGLGTPATRASIIETLLRRGYIARDKQQLIATAMGMGLIGALPVASLASAELTGGWEARLARIARGEDSRVAFMADIRRYVTEIVDAIRGAAPPEAPPAVSIGRCPRCGHDVVSRSRGYPCTSCDFAMPNRVAGRMIAPAL
ncbi:MAG TPA: DNA topoisomerase, partial [Kofleriaceae bacterium]|nr:DNA topoisomerase [Kofleriaceae bacterium]